MKFKGLIVGVLVLAVLMPTAVFADSDTVVETRLELSGGDFLFKTSGGIHKLDYRCTPTRTITIKETQGGGLIKEGKIIYLKLDEGLLPEHIDVKSIDKDTRVGVESIDENNIIKIKLEKMSNDKLMELQITFGGFYLGGTTGYIRQGPFGISLLTSDQYPDNLFAELPTSEKVLNDEFINIQSNDFSVTKVKTVAFKADESSVYIAGSESPLSTPAYMNEKNQLMIPIRAAAEAFGKGEVNWDFEKNCAVFTINQKSFILESGSTQIEADVNESVAGILNAPIISKNGTIYMYPDDLAKLFSIDKADVLWEDEGRTVRFVFESE